MSGQTCNIKKKKKKKNNWLLLPCKHQTHQDSGKAPQWWPKEREQSKQWRRSARLQTASACHSSQPCFPGPAAPTGGGEVEIICTRNLCCEEIKNAMCNRCCKDNCCLSRPSSCFENTGVDYDLWYENKNHIFFWEREMRLLKCLSDWWIKLSSYWDGEGFALVVKRHASSVTSLGQHAIEVVLTARWEEPGGHGREELKQQFFFYSDNALAWRAIHF